jgi:hypothetical protein
MYIHCIGLNGSAERYSVPVSTVRTNGRQYGIIADSGPFNVYTNIHIHCIGLNCSPERYSVPVSTVRTNGRQYGIIADSGPFYVYLKMYIHCISLNGSAKCYNVPASTVRTNGHENITTADSGPFAMVGLQASATIGHPTSYITAYSLTASTTFHLSINSRLTHLYQSHQSGG